MKAKILLATVTMLTVVCITGCNTDTETVTKEEVTTTKKVIERTTTEEVTTEEETTSNIVDGIDMNEYVGAGNYGHPKGEKKARETIEFFIGKRFYPGDEIHINEFFGEEISDISRGESTRCLCGALGIEIPDEMKKYLDEMEDYEIPFEDDFYIINTTGKELAFGQNITEDKYDYMINIYERK